MTNLKKNLELGQTGRAKARSNLKSSLEDIKNTKANFDAERAAWDTENATLLKRAEDAENQLKPVTEEFSA